MKAPDIPRRIRERREQRRLAGYQLARMARISPSYLSLIEGGKKVPSVDIALRLAKVLRDDLELYRAWAEGDYEGDLDGRIARLERAREHRRGSPRERRVLPRSPGPPPSAGPREPDELRLSLVDPDGEWEPDMRDEGPAVLEVPVLPPGGDPDDLDAYGTDRLDSIRVDAGLIPDDIDTDDLFAYRLDDAMTDRVRPLLGAGDVVVLAPSPDGVDAKAIHAVRLNDRVVLSRVVYHEPLLLLTESDPYADPVSIEAGSPSRLARVLAGVVVASMRTWKPAVELQRPGRDSPPLRRSGRLEDGDLVRDCDWKERYGWRPVQRPEDMDYLDEHPGSKIRFRLMKGGVVRYLLEMDADQWREALGTYYTEGKWRQNGYITPVTKSRNRRYTEEFQPRWRPFVRRA